MSTDAEVRMADALDDVAGRLRSCAAALRSGDRARIREAAALCPTLRSRAVMVLTRLRAQSVGEEAA